MAAELVPVTFNKILQSRAYTVIILGTEEKKFAIYTDPHVGRNIQLYLTEEHKPRPYTHDLITSIFDGLDIKVIQVVINDVEDTIYFARIFLEQQVGDERHILEIDARPSDCITLALMRNTPVFCKRSVLEKAVAVED
jgi:bifunctional DNase/RNase